MRVCVTEYNTTEKLKQQARRGAKAPVKATPAGRVTRSLTKQRQLTPDEENKIIRDQIGAFVSEHWHSPEVLFGENEKLDVAHYCLAQTGDGHAWSNARTCEEFVKGLANRYYPMWREDIALIASRKV